MDRVLLTKGCPYGLAGWQDNFALGTRAPMQPFMKRLQHLNHSLLHQYMRTGRWIAEGFAFNVMQQAFGTALVRSPSIAMVVFRSNMSCTPSGRNARYGMNAAECVQLKR